LWTGCCLKSLTAAETAEKGLASVSPLFLFALFSPHPRQESLFTAYFIAGHASLLFSG